jgi:hypothetical protein
VGQIGKEASSGFTTTPYRCADALLTREVPRRRSALLRPRGTGRDGGRFGRRRLRVERAGQRQGRVAQPAITVAGTVTARTITGLTAGKSYTFEVAARNTVGTGVQSAPSNAVVPT